MNFSNEEKVKMVEVFFRCRRNSADALRVYREAYPERRAPHRTYFRKLIENLNNYGSFVKPKNNEYGAAEADVLAFFEIHPRASIRDCARESGLSLAKIHAILKKHNWKAFKILPVHQLRDGDSVRRLRFCQWILNNNFLENILWSDESQFTNCGIFNRKNEHFWSVPNTHQHSEVKPQVKFSFNVLYGAGFSVKESLGLIFIMVHLMPKGTSNSCSER